MTYRAILLKTKGAETLPELLDGRREANLAELNGTLTMSEVTLLLVARHAVRKALQCRTFTAVALLRVAFARIHVGLFKLDGDPEGAAEWFFNWLLTPRLMKLFYASQYGKGFTRRFSSPQRALIDLDNAMVTASGRRQ